MWANPCRVYRAWSALSTRIEHSARATDDWRTALGRQSPHIEPNTSFLLLPVVARVHTLVDVAFP